MRRAIPSEIFDAKSRFAVLRHSGSAPRCSQRKRAGHAFNLLTRHVFCINPGAVSIEVYVYHIETYTISHSSCPGIPGLHRITTNL